MGIVNRVQLELEHPIEAAVAVLHQPLVVLVELVLHVPDVVN